MEAMAEASGCPLSVSVQQPPNVPDRWREIQAWAAGAGSRGLDIWTQVAPRPIGLLLGCAASVHPFSACPAYAEVAHLDVAKRAAVLSNPDLRDRILGQHRKITAGLSTEGFAGQIMAGYDVMFKLDDPVDYDLRPETSLAAEAARSGRDPAELLYETLLEEDGSRLLYTPLFNFASGDLSAVRQMIRHERALFGLSDAGAHCRAICDASFTTSFLTLWARDRSDRLAIEEVVRRITRDTARHVGWLDRGALQVGMVADVNVIDLDELGCAPPRITADLPAGGTRLLQSAYGYRYTVKTGQVVFEGGEHTGQLPGGLLRGPKAAS
jgi:N-acyl-D-aspartate/D-glutamate deacylase